MYHILYPVTSPSLNTPEVFENPIPRSCWFPGYIEKNVVRSTFDPYLTTYLHEFLSL